MGWGRTLLLGDVGNRLDIADTERDIAQLKREIDDRLRADKSQDSTLRALMIENAELKLYLAAVIRLLTANGTISRDELKAMVAAVDGEDGNTDGKCDGPVA